MKLFWAVRKFVKRLLGDRIEGWCCDCGRSVEGWVMEDALWLRVVGRKDGDNLCLYCFDRRATAQYVYLVYKVTEHVGAVIPSVMEERLKTYLMNYGPEYP